jgi:quinoprotein dehydrogenase-associated probable ABC transporter substrate-binding protein
MFSRCLDRLYSFSNYTPAKRGVSICLAAVLLGASGGFVRAEEASPARVLRVASDPNNLPFSNQKLEGFENRLADLLAHELNARIEYTWWAQRRGFFRNTMKEGECDLVMGVPKGFEMTLTTVPYYRSTYVFVYRADRHLDLHSLDDPALRRLRVGVQMIGDDFANSPPAHALSARGIVNNVTGYTVYGDYSRENPPAQIIEAVAKGEIDVALVWGPLAGFFAKRQATELTVEPVSPEKDGPLPFVFDICVGVRKGNARLRDEVNAVLARKHEEIAHLLDDYGIPQVHGKLAAQR